MFCPIISLLINSDTGNIANNKKLDLKVDVKPWSSDVRPSFSGGGLEGEYLLHTVHLHWGEGES